ncbi:VOC family protein [Shinella zoogloeoides]|uniref:Ring-cleaving dioxygenase n=1 Tax=Shinella zoogloeoides TaxID=352475 RepID=A0A6N8TDG0_SHIZO|nr:VOC family protein [Shinella zoogloeoides]MXO00979.1 ring-cleaving dioxygenase [Shinella zoogloeoides]UEX80506.1 VOC family protein [Shinella zoogloeoides]
MTSGIHHITAITRKIQANVDFYAGFLGLRLVKRTAGYEDADQLHLFYGDAAASPGSLITFLAWEDGSPGRVGLGQPSEIALAIRPEAIGFWLTRALTRNIAMTGPAQEFGEPVLRLKDPDGIIVKLVGQAGVEGPAPHVTKDIAAGDAIQRIRGATILSEKPAETAGFIAGHFGFRPVAETDGVTRLAGEAGDVLDIRNAGGFWTSAPGIGTIDHVALRAPDRAAVEAIAGRLAAEAAGDTNMHDRTYFYSLYVREPGGSLVEYATDGPGMTVDEPLETLGTRLFVPRHFRADPDDVRARLPQFSLPGEERMTERDLPFIHRVHRPENPDGTAVVLLHGTGGNETSLLPFGARLAPDALLLSPRGRSTDEGYPRFFRRLTAVTFDQKDIVQEAEAFAAFMEGANAAYGLDPDKTLFVGYSNGANMIGAIMLLHPGLIRNAVLLRGMNVLETVPQADLAGANVLMVTGRSDPYGRYAGELEAALTAAGATVESELLAAGHDIGMADLELAKAYRERVIG